MSKVCGGSPEAWDAAVRDASELYGHKMVRHGQKWGRYGEMTTAAWAKNIKPTHRGQNDHPVCEEGGIG